MKNILIQSETAQQQTGQYLHHYTFNTGHTATHSLQATQQWETAMLLPLLKKGSGNIPGMLDFKFALGLETNGSQFVLGHRGRELATGGVAWGAGMGDCLWICLNACYQKTVPWVPGWLHGCPAPMPPLPWLGVVWHLELEFISPAQARRIAAFERDLALILIRQALGKN